MSYEWSFYTTTVLEGYKYNTFHKKLDATVAKSFDVRQISINQMVIPTLLPSLEVYKYITFHKKLDAPVAKSFDVRQILIKLIEKHVSKFFLIDLC